MAITFLTKSALQRAWDKMRVLLQGKQDLLTSGSNIKTIDNESLLGSGNIEVSSPIRTQGNYLYRIHKDNTFECWFKQVGFTIAINNASGNLYRSPLTSLALPSELYNNYACNIMHAEVNCSHNNYPAWGTLASIYDTGVNYYAMSGGSRSSSPNYTLTAYMFGTLS